MLSLSPATHSMGQSFHLVFTNNCHPFKISSVFPVTPSSAQNPTPKILQPHLDLPSTDSLTLMFDNPQFFTLLITQCRSTRFNTTINSALAPFPPTHFIPG